MLPIILISQNEGQTKEFVDDYIKKNAFNTHYIYELHPLKTELTIEQVRELKKDLIYTSQEKRLVIFYSFESANIEAQNALLKTLEEKNVQNQFILVTAHSERVLPTIRSRSKIIVLQDTSTPTETVEELKKQLETSIIQGTVPHLLSQPYIKDISRDGALELFKTLLTLYREHITDWSSAPSIVKKILQTMQLLQNNNLNPQLAVDHIVIYIKKQ